MGHLCDSSKDSCLLDVTDETPLQFEIHWIENSWCALWSFWDLGHFFGPLNFNSPTESAYAAQGPQACLRNGAVEYILRWAWMQKFVWLLLDSLNFIYSPFLHQRGQDLVEIRKAREPAWRGKSNCAVNSPLGECSTAFFLHSLHNYS